MNIGPIGSVRRCIWALVLGASVGFAGTARGAATLVPVATTRTPAPGVPGATIARIGLGAATREGLYSLMGSGKLAFAAAVQTPGNQATGVWTFDGAQLELALQPDFERVDDTRCTNVMEGPFLLENGKLVVLCSLSGRGSYAESLFYGDPGALEPKVLAGSAAPGTGDPALTFYRISNVMVRAPSFVAFESTLDSATVNLGGAGAGVWLWSPGSFTSVARRGAPAPSAPGHVIEALHSSALDGSGRVLMTGRRSGTAAYSLWLGDGSAPATLVAENGGPTTVDGESVRLESELTRAALTDSGEVVLLAASRSNGTARAVWFGAPGQPLSPALAPNGSRIVPDSGSLVVSAGGRIALTGREDTPRTTAAGLWSGTAGSLKLIAKYDAPLRGLEDIVLRRVDSIQLNDRGHLVLRVWAALSGKEGEHVLRYAPATGFEPVFTLGAVVDDHGEARAITAVVDHCDARHQTAQRHRCLDDEGRYAFLAEYADGAQGLLLTDALPDGGEDVDLSVPSTSPDGGSPGNTGGTPSTSPDGGTQPPNGGRPGEGGSSSSSGGAGAGQGGARPATGGRTSGGAGGADAVSGGADESGCSCTLPGRSPASLDAAIALVVGTSLLVSRRRRSGRRR